MNPQINGYCSRITEGSMEFNQHKIDLIKIWFDYLNKMEASLSDILHIRDALDSSKEYFDKLLDNTLDKDTLLIYINQLNKIYDGIELTNIEKHMDCLPSLKSENFDKSCDAVSKMQSFLENGIHFYNFLIDLYDNHLSTYEAQNNRKAILKAFEWKLGSGIPKQYPRRYVQTLNKFLKKQNLGKGYKKIENGKNPNVSQLKHYRELIKNAIDYNVTATYPNENDKTTMTIAGQFIQTSKLSKFNDQLESVKYLNVFASNTIFFDGNYTLAGKGIQLAMVAPKWVIQVPNVAIILDGADGKPQLEANAKNGTLKIVDGANGKPGFPGGSAGPFLGIMDTIEDKNNWKLQIHSNGGKGGSGQNGGYGYKGIDDTVYNPNKECDPKEATTPIKKIRDERVNVYYIILGKDGTKGANGGNGGAGGYPGSKGEINIIPINKKDQEVSSHIQIFANMGETGENGQVGKGGIGGLKSNVTWLFNTSIFVSYHFNCNTTVEHDNSSNYESGLDGANIISNIEPSTVIFQKRFDTINEYKSFARWMKEQTRVTKSLYNFLENLDENIEYDDKKLLSYANDLEYLEKQYPLIKNKNTLKYFYARLQEKINNISGKHDSDKSNFQEFLTQIISKRRNMDEISLEYDVERIHPDINDYYDRLRAYKYTVIKQNKEKIREKVANESHKSIETEVKPIIEEALYSIEEMIGEVLINIRQLQIQNENDGFKLQKQRSKLQKLVAFKAIVGTLNVATSVLSMAFPPVGVVSKAIDVINSLVPSDVESVNVIKMPPIVQNIKTETADLETTKKDFEKVNTDIKKLFGAENGNKIAKDLTKLLEDNADDAAKAIALIKNFIIKKKPANGDEKHKQLETIGSILNLGKLSGNILVEIGDSYDKINDMSKAIGEVNENKMKLKIYEKQIKENISSSKKKLASDITNFYNSAKDQSSPTAEIKSFKIKKIINDFQYEFEENIEGLINSKRTHQVFETIKIALDTIDNVYKRLDKYYNDHENFINMNDSKYTKSTDVPYNNPKYDEATRYLSFFESRNDLIIKYDRLLPKFKMMIFPLIAYTEWLLEDEKNDVDKKLNEVLVALPNMKTSYTKMKSSNQIFYRLPGNDRRLQLESILNGKEISLLTDISDRQVSEKKWDARHMDAVKFKTIGIQMNFNDPYDQKDFDRAMENYEVILKHSGESLYKYKTNNITVHGGKKTIKYPYSNKFSNVITDSIDKIEYFMSPYTRWTLQIKPIIGEPEDLTRFLNSNSEFFLTGEGHLNDDTLHSRLSTEGFEEYYGIHKPNVTTVNHIKSTTKLRWASPKKFLTSLAMLESTTSDLSDVPQLNHTDLNANLLLLDVLLRKKQGRKNQLEKQPISDSNRDVEYANSLAYSAYAPSDASN